MITAQISNQENAMWAQYRKTAIPIQLMILVAAVVLYGFAKVPLPGLLLFLVAMEVGAILGAWWGARLKRKLNAEFDKLPLR